ncbi:MAG: hypothetical protein LBT32_03260 [Peptococcaceae bacterium]|jgi:hypothetical protein|nr:hypothetical protein [Peptococcaceae bacterium]
MKKSAATCFTIMLSVALSGSLVACSTTNSDNNTLPGSQAPVENNAQRQTTAKQTASQPENHIIVKMIDEADRKIVENSGAGWQYTFNGDVPIEEYHTTLRQFILDYSKIDIADYYGKTILIRAYDTVPKGSYAYDYSVKLTYVFAFVDDALVDLVTLNRANDYEILRRIGDRLYEIDHPREYGS